MLNTIMPMLMIFFARTKLLALAFGQAGKWRTFADVISFSIVYYFVMFKELEQSCLAVIVDVQVNPPPIQQPARPQVMQKCALPVNVRHSITALVQSKQRLPHSLPISPSLTVTVSPLLAALLLYSGASFCRAGRQ